MSEREGGALGADRWLRAQRAAVTRGRIAAALAGAVLLGVLVRGLAIYSQLPAELRVWRGRAGGAEVVAKNPFEAFFSLLVGAALLAVVVYSVRDERASAGRRWAELKVLPGPHRAFVLAPTQEATYYAGAILALTMAALQWGTWEAWRRGETYAAWPLAAGCVLTFLVASAGALVSRARVKALGTLLDEPEKDERDHKL